ncbi:hypothetical protein AWV79_33980 [Cupriavidus sp. UYMMa02A]|nr:hypothetical protein AWV79_33980 [Cupriavidus sp. UYMMa02A]
MQHAPLAQLHDQQCLGRIVLFVAVDDHARIAFTAMHPDEKKESAVQFLRDAVAYYASLGITVRRLLTDNGSPFRSREFAEPARRWAFGTSCASRPMPGPIRTPRSAPNP